MFKEHPKTLALLYGPSSGLASVGPVGPVGPVGLVGLVRTTGPVAGPDGGPVLYCGFLTGLLYSTGVKVSVLAEVSEVSVVSVVFVWHRL